MWQARAGFLKVTCKEIFMALQISMSLECNFGTSVDFADLYIKVGHIAGDKSQLQFNLDYYTSDKSRLLKSEQYEFSPVVPGDCCFKQAYSHLKSLDKFSGATDC